MIQTETDHIAVPLEGHLTTNTQGIRRLLSWYQSISTYRNTTVYTCCRGLEWLDANLAAMWNALIYKLKKENNVIVILDQASLAQRFSILIRNGFTAPTITATRQPRSFIRNASFGPEEGDQFLAYIESEIMQQQQIQNLPPELRGLLEGNLYELYLNVFKHAGTSDPFFVCGQYFRNRQELVVSLMDLGQSFLPAINSCTCGMISTQRDAIDWAVQGNSELGAKGGGHALKCIKKEFEKNDHALQIVTGNAFWDSSYSESVLGAHRELPQPIPGTMVSFIFKIGLSS